MIWLWQLCRKRVNIWDSFIYRSFIFLDSNWSLTWMIVWASTMAKAVIKFLKSSYAKLPLTLKPADFQNVSGSWLKYEETSILFDWVSRVLITLVNSSLDTLSSAAGLKKFHSFVHWSWFSESAKSFDSLNATFAVKCQNLLVAVGNHIFL